MDKSMLGPSGHKDDFTRRNLPAPAAWPQISLAGYDYPDWLNAGVELTDRMVAEGFGDRRALIGADRHYTYAELAEWTDRLAAALVGDCGIVPGNRVLLRGPNSPAMVACWLAVMKAGAVAVNTMPMLRAGELSQIIDKAEICLALCDVRLMDEMEACAKDNAYVQRIVSFGGGPGEVGELEGLADAQPGGFAPVQTGRDDVALLAFTSGTTGAPKATMHFHRDLLVIADGYAKDVLAIGPEDICIGTPPLAFTFGLGGLAIFPLRFGAATILEEKLPPDVLGQVIARHQATISFTSPTAYRVMLADADCGQNLGSLRLAVSAGETLPAPVFEQWIEKTGVPILDGIGATEMLHIFVSNRQEDAAAGATGRATRGYEAQIVDADMQPLPKGAPGQLAVRGPTGCRYLADDRQAVYVRNGWNVTGDSFVQDEEGVFHFVARADDMIISAGYNIAAPEVEAALLAHESVVECAVVGAPDPERGAVVAAHIVLGDNVLPTPETAKLLQDHVKAQIAPYKYPRVINFVDALPKTQTGKIQRYQLRQSGSKS